MDTGEYVDLLKKVLSCETETEVLEFKKDNTNPDQIGEYISALSNSAAFIGVPKAYLVWGIDDSSHRPIGASFKPYAAKAGNQPLESWLNGHIEPKINFRFYEVQYDGLSIVILEVPACQYIPIRWRKEAYIRIGNVKTSLLNHPDKERELWLRLAREPFEKGTALPRLTADEVLNLLDYDTYFRLTKQVLASTKRGIMDRLALDNIISRDGTDRYNITNLGAVLFAVKLSMFGSLGRKAVRLITYRSVNRMDGGNEIIADAGYAAVFENLISRINAWLPANEHIGKALRIEDRIYPEIAIREIVANALIHQDFWMTGDSPIIEIFTDRMEITNSGIPLIDTLRFIDEPPQSRNEIIAAMMRRMMICEERGSGIDKVIQSVEALQLPAPRFSRTEKHTKVSLYAYKAFSDMSMEDRMRACYQHTCLLYVSGHIMTNASLRNRFQLDASSYTIISRIISCTMKEKLIKPNDPDSKSRRHAQYIPFWA